MAVIKINQEVLGAYLRELESLNAELRMLNNMIENWKYRMESFGRNLYSALEDSDFDIVLRNYCEKVHASDIDFNEVLKINKEMEIYLYELLECELLEWKDIRY